MTEYTPHSLWADILKLHWKFLETEESPRKLEECKQLQACLKDFLCVVPHDRKFFLPETGHVLKRSILEMDDFTAYKAIIGFESISQYANNLFTKPWRKEFRLLKVYSGFYQHEIQSNLVDAEKLFEAMGYKRVSKEIMILDEPICPDQVTNVSRDAMAAYMECKIIKQIYAGLVALNLSCTWAKIFRFREKHKGSPTQAVKELSYALEERYYSEKFNNLENTCSTIQRSQSQSNASALPTHSSSQNWTTSKDALNFLQPGDPDSSLCALHSSNKYEMPSNSQSMHICNGLVNKRPTFLPNRPIAHTPHYRHSTLMNSRGLPQITHSRSLEHYNKLPVQYFHQQHSFDHLPHGCDAHQQVHNLYGLSRQNVYESPYDCLDDGSIGSSVSYADLGDATVSPEPSCKLKNTHPYNISANCYPLPSNLANQLLTTYPSSSSNYRKVQNEPYCCNSYQEDDPPPLVSARNVNVLTMTNFNGKSAFLVDNLDNCDDALLNHPQPNNHAKTHSFTSHDCTMDYESYPLTYDVRQERLTDIRNASYAPPQDHHIYDEASQCPSADIQIMYAQPQVRGNRRRTSIMETSVRRPLDCTETKKELRQNLNHRSLTDPSYDDFRLEEKTVHDNSQSSTQYCKNQDGRGSFESWNYVFQNLQQAGYSKDLGERDDLLVQGLDLDSLNLANDLMEKRRTANQAESKVGRQPQTNVRNISLVANSECAIDKAGTLDKAGKLVESHLANGKQEQPMPNLRQDSVRHTDINPKSSSKNTSNQFYVLDNNNDNSNTNVTMLTENSSLARNSNSTSTKQPTIGSTAAPTKGVIVGTDEWSCQACTYINPKSQRICEICCKTRSLLLENTMLKTPTLV